MVTAIIVVNAYGFVGDVAPDIRRAVVRQDMQGASFAGRNEANTTLAVVIVDGAADHDALARCAIAAHDGFARAIHPCHTLYDGDLVLAVATKEGSLDPADLIRLAIATELAVEGAILNAVAGKL